MNPSGKYCIGHKGASDMVWGRILLPVSLGSLTGPLFPKHDRGAVNPCTKEYVEMLYVPFAWKKTGFRKRKFR